MYELKKKIGNLLTSKSVGTGPSSYEKRIYRAAVSQRLRHTVLSDTLRTRHLHSQLFFFTSWLPALDLHNHLAVILDIGLSDRFQNLLVLVFAYRTHLTETYWATRFCLCCKICPKFEKFREEVVRTSHPVQSGVAVAWSYIVRLFLFHFAWINIFDRRVEQITVNARRRHLKLMRN